MNPVKGPATNQRGWAQIWAQSKMARIHKAWKLLVRKGGLEPPWVSPPDPKSGASANSATFALERASESFQFSGLDSREKDDRRNRGLSTSSVRTGIGAAVYPGP
jgi:hypothetical protein